MIFEQMSLTALIFNVTYVILLFIGVGFAVWALYEFVIKDILKWIKSKSEVNKNGRKV